MMLILMRMSLKAYAFEFVLIGGSLNPRHIPA